MRILAPVVGTLVLGGQKKEHGECRKNTYGQRHRDEDLSVQAIVNPDFQVEGLSPTRTLAQTALWEIISHNPTCGPLRPKQRFGIPLLRGVSMQVLLKRTVPGNAHPLDTRVSLTRWR